MALPSTHLRFALDLADTFPVADMGLYISGTMYPDSRWITGRRREATHGDSCRSPEGAQTDFTRGWYVHCLCDCIQSQVCQSLFPAWEQLTPDERWMEKSVVSMLQDCIDLPTIDINACLALMNHPRGPLGENPLQVQRYYDIIRQVYAGKTVLAREDFYALWLLVGLPGDRARAVMDHMEKRMQDPHLQRIVSGLYPRMIQQARRV